MKTLKDICAKILVLSAVILSVAGCVATQGFTVTARAGDTVTFAIGALDNVKKADVQLVYYSDSNPGVPIDITTSVRSIVRLYPDKTSLSYWEKVAGGNGIETIDTLVDFSSHGPWQTVAIVDLPTTLPAGTGYVRFTMGAKVTYPQALARVDDVVMALTILSHDDGSPMIGAAHEFGFRKYAFNGETSVGNINKLEPLRQVVLRSLPTSSPSAPISAANYKLTFSVLDESANDITANLTADDFAIVLDDSPRYVRGQVSLIWKKSNSAFDISVTSPAQPISPQLVRFSILLSNVEDTAANGWTIAGGSVSLQSYNYYDAQGAEMSGPAPNVRIMYN